MSVCEALCQHPACWKAEIDAKRLQLKRDHTWTPSREDEYNKTYVKNVPVDHEYGSLPTYKVLNLLEDGFFGDSDKFGDEDEDEDEYPKWSSFNLYQNHEQKASSGSTSISSFVSISQKNQKVLDKLRWRQKEVENLENIPSSAISLKYLQLNDVGRNGKNYQKVFTWVPGRKVVLLYFGIEIGSPSSVCTRNISYLLIMSYDRGFQDNSHPSQFLKKKFEKLLMKYLGSS